MRQPQPSSGRRHHQLPFLHERIERLQLFHGGLAQLRQTSGGAEQQLESRGYAEHGSLLETAAKAPRQADGSLLIGFARLLASRDLLDQSVNVGLSFNGSGLIWGCTNIRDSPHGRK